MTGWLIGSAVRLRRLVVAAVVAVLALGLFQLRQATVDVYPEYEQTAVQVQTDALGLSAVEVEQLITVPLEQNLLNGIPRLEEISSRSMSGLSVIDLTFEPGTDVYLARQLVQERMTRVNLLPHVGTPPVMVQPTAATSRVAMVGVRSDSVSLIDMSVLAQWQMRPRLMSIAGVANVSIWGLRDRELQVQVDPERLVASNVTLTQLIEATGNAMWVSPLSFVEASTPGTGGFLESPNQRIGVQHVSPVTAAEQLADVTVQRPGGPPLRLGDLADVREDHQPLIGNATSDGQQSLMLVVERFPAADTAQVSRDVDAALEAMAPGLSGITLDATVYRPTAYLDTALGRLGTAVLVGLILMLAVLLVVTLSWRVALICATAVGLSLVAAVYVLHLRDATLTTMTVVGLAAVMALVVDDAVGDVADMRAGFERRRAAGESAVTALATGSIAARRTAIAFATVAVLVAIAPLMLLSGTAAAFARPALLTFALAVLASLVVALVATPALAVLLLGRGTTGSSRVGPFAGWVGRGVDRIVSPSVGRRVPAFVALAVLAVLAVAGTSQLRPGKLLPELQDRSVLVRMEAAPGTSLPEMDRITGRAAAELRTVPGVASAGTHVGRAVGADRTVDVDVSEIWLTIEADADHAGTLEAVRTTVAGYPGLRSEVRTYGEAQLASVASAPEDQLVVRVFGRDLETLRTTADQVREALATIDGVISPVVEAQPVEPIVEIHVDLPAAQRWGVQPGDVRRAASTMISGLVVGSLYEQQAIFDVVVWGGPATRHSVHDIAALTIETPSGARVPLGGVARVVQTSDPATIEHHAVSRSVDVTARIQGRDAAAVAADTTARLQQLTYPYEYRAEVVGDVADRPGAPQGLLPAWLAAALLVFLLLQAATSSWRGAATLFVCVPLAGAGAVVTALFLGDVGSVAVFAAVFAVVALTVRQALVLVRRARALTGPADRGTASEAMRRAVEDTAPTVLAALLVTAAAFLPAAVMGGGAGLEFVHPFAVTLLGGLVTSAVVVLFLVPALYPAVGALTSPPDESDDPYAGRLDDHEDDAVRLPAPRPQTDNGRTAGRPGSVPAEGRAMRTSRSVRVAPRRVAWSSLAAGLVLAGCQSAQPAGSGEAAAAGEPAAVVQPAEDGGPARIVLSAEAEERLGLETAPVGGALLNLVVPYGSVVYDGAGAAWTFAVVGDRTYQRAAITVADIVGIEARLSAGPAPGTEVVTVGAAELVGVEAGISGGE